MTGEINGKELTPTRTGDGDGDGGGGGGSGSIDQVAAYIPEEYVDSCEPTEEPYYEAAIESAYCEIEGVDAMWYDLFADQASLNEAVANDVSDLDAVEGSCADAADGTPIVNTYTLTIEGTEVGSEDHKILCWVNDDGAWVEQADPHVYVIWTGLQEDGDIGALATWAENSTILSATEPQQGEAGAQRLSSAPGASRGRRVSGALGRSRCRSGAVAGRCSNATGEG